MKTNYKIKHFKRNMFSLPSLLIIDPDIRFSVSLALRLEPEMEVFTTTTAKEGLSLFQTKPVSMVLLDLDIPDTSGLEALRIIREQSSDIKVLVTTGSNSQERATQCANLAVNGLLQKPIDIRTIVERIKKMIGNDHVKFLKYLWKHKYEAMSMSIGHTVKNAMCYVHQNYHRKDFSRSKVAVHLGLSCDYLSRLFHKESGMRLKDYVTQLRIFKSKELLLKHPCMKIEIIATSIGIKDVNYFYKYFERHTGLSCKDFRKSISD